MAAPEQLVGIQPAAADISEVRDYWLLLKPNVMSLVVFSAAAGLYLAPGRLHPVLAFVAILCIAAAAGAAAAINNGCDVDIDRAMARTRLRPTATGRISRDDALAFGVILAVISTMVMGLAVNWVAAALLVLTIAFYVFVYTLWLKRRTPQNIVIGGAAGAFPPMVGWAAVTGDVSLASIVLFLIIFVWTPPHFWALALYRCRDYERVGVPMLPVVAGLEKTRQHILGYVLALVPVSLASIVLFLIIFVWTPPHFWSLALYRCRDYARVGVPMLPVVAGLEKTRQHILGYVLALVPVSLLPWGLGLSGPLYGLAALALGAVFLGYAIRLWRDRTQRTATRTFRYSIVYLFALFFALVADKALGFAATAGSAGGAW